MKDPRGFFLLLPAEPDMRHFAGIMSVEKHKVTVAESIECGLMWPQVPPL
jgi:hypothetical protein